MPGVELTLLPRPRRSREDHRPRVAEIVGEIQRIPLVELCFQGEIVRLGRDDSLQFPPPGLLSALKDDEATGGGHRRLLDDRRSTVRWGEAVRVDRERVDDSRTRRVVCDRPCGPRHQKAPRVMPAPPVLTRWKPESTRVPNAESMIDSASCRSTSLETFTMISWVLLSR